MKHTGTSETSQQLLDTLKVYHAIDINLDHDRDIAVLELQVMFDDWQFWLSQKKPNIVDRIFAEIRRIQAPQFQQQPCQLERRSMPSPGSQSRSLHGSSVMFIKADLYCLIDLLPATALKRFQDMLRHSAFEMPARIIIGIMRQIKRKQLSHHFVTQTKHPHKHDFATVKRSLFGGGKAKQSKS